MKIKKAFILAAGLGTRLEKITRQTPKALIPVNGIPMLQILIEKLSEFGIDEIVINIHHHGDQIIEFLRASPFSHLDIKISDERGKLLDTGGALVKARPFFEKTKHILVHNVDVISNIHLDHFYKYHEKYNASATLCVRNRQSSRALLFDNELNLTGWSNNEKQTFKWVDQPKTNYQSFAFSGIYIINSELIEQIRWSGKFSIIDAWLMLAKHNVIKAFVDDSSLWFDLGTNEKIKTAETYLKNKELG